MEDKKSEILERSPNRMLTNFSKGYLWFGILVTIVVHVVFVGGTSVQYINDTYIDKEGAKIRKEAAALEKKKAADKVENDKKLLAAGSTNALAGRTNAPAGGTNDVAAKVEAEPAKPAAGSDTLAGIPASMTNSAIVRRVTELPKPEEIPRNPDDIPQ